jgi:hypothetical protein
MNRTDATAIRISSGSSRDTSGVMADSSSSSSSSTAT